MNDCRALLSQLGISFVEVVSPNDGYDGTYEPSGVMLHWTASAKGSDTSSAVIAGNSYHYCVSRDGVVKVGGYNVKQAHGGSGRTEPLSLARDACITVDDLTYWQNCGADDNTDSWPNRYFVGVSIDNDGVGEEPPDIQWYAWCGTAAAVLVALGKPVGAIVDHATSTNRKIDIATSPQLPTSKWYADIQAMITLLLGGPAVMQYTFDVSAGHPSGNGCLGVRSDGRVYVINVPGKWDAGYHGSVGDIDADPHTDDALVGTYPPIAAWWSPSGEGYTIVNKDGGVFCFGDAIYPGNFREWVDG